MNIVMIFMNIMMIFMDINDSFLLIEHLHHQNCFYFFIFFFFCIYKIYLISAEGYKNAGVHILIIKKYINWMKFGQA